MLEDGSKIRADFSHLALREEGIWVYEQ